MTRGYITSDPHGRWINHAVILKIVSTNICGSDQHMVRGRTTAPAGVALGHDWNRIFFESVGREAGAYC